MSDRTEIRSGYLQPAFLICVGVLAAACAGMSVARQRLGLYLKKEPLPLKQPLDRLDEAALAPYEVVAKLTIRNEEILRSLGFQSACHKLMLTEIQETLSLKIRQFVLKIFWFIDNNLPGG